MSGPGSQRPSGGSGSTQSSIPKPRPRFPIPPVRTTSSVPKVVRPSIAFVRPPPSPDEVPSPHMPSPGTESSHPPSPQEGSTLPRGRDPVDGRTWIYPEKRTFNPPVCSVREILPVIEGKFDQPYHSWKVIPANYRQMWFEEWARKYKWHPQHENDVRRIWNGKCQDIFRSLMYRVRRDFFHKEVKPHWIPREVMDQLESYWISPDYLCICDTAAKNRASATGGTQHKGGSIPNSEHKRRMADNLGREPSVFEVFKKTHLNDQTGQFADHRAAAMHDEFLKRKEAINSEGGDIMSNQDEFNLWLEVIGGKNKKGRIYGLGSEDDIGSSSTPPSVNSAVDPEMTQMKEEVASLKLQNEMIMSAIQAFGIPLPNISNPATNDEALHRDNENDS